MVRQYSGNVCNYIMHMVGRFHVPSYLHLQTSPVSMKQTLLPTTLQTSTQSIRFASTTTVVSLSNQQPKAGYQHHVNASKTNDNIS